MTQFKRYLPILLLALLLALTIPAFAQDEDLSVTPAALTVEPVATEEAVATADATQEAGNGGTENNAGSVSDEAVAVASVNLLFAFVGGLAVGGLGIGSIILLLVTLILRSPVILTAIEGLIFSRLDKEGVATVRGFGTVFTKTGELIDKVTDGKPNEPAQNVTVNVTSPVAPAG